MEFCFSELGSETYLEGFVRVLSPFFYPFCFCRSIRAHGPLFYRGLVHHSNDPADTNTTQVALKSQLLV